MNSKIYETKDSICWCCNSNKLYYNKLDNLFHCFDCGAERHHHAIDDNDQLVNYGGIMTEKSGDVALKYDQSFEKLPWDLLPVEAVEGMLRVLLYGQRKYTVCGNCLDKNAQPTRVYPNPRLDGDPTREDCPVCGSRNVVTGAHNWRKGFKWTRLIAAAFRHLKAVLECEDIDPESGLPHIDHLACMVAFISGHQKKGYGVDDRYKENTNNSAKLDLGTADSDQHDHLYINGKAVQWDYKKKEGDVK